MSLRLNSEVTLKSDGTILESEALAIEDAVITQLESAVLTDAAGEGQRASAISFSMSRTVDLRNVGAEVPCECVIDHLGYLSNLNVTVRASVGG